MILVARSGHQEKKLVWSPGKDAKINEFYSLHVECITF